MKKLVRLFVALSLGLTLSSAAMAQAPKAYFDQEVSGWAQPYLVVDGQTYNMGQWVPYYEINELFESNTMAEKYANLHVKHARRAAWSIWGGLGVYALAAFVPSRDNESRDEIFLGGSVVLIGALLYGGYQGSLSRSYLYKAINEYNGVTTKSDTTDLSMNGPKLSWTFTF